MKREKKLGWMASKKVIILNGAPSSGKDTIANFFRDVVGLEKMEVKKDLFDIALCISGISEGDWFERYDNRELNLKEVPWNRLNGISQRDFLIRISEDWVKFVFGKDVFGVKAAARIQESGSTSFVFSDVGFKEELEAITSVVGEDNVLLVRLHRFGCTFNGDSRTHLSHKHEIDINNDHDISIACSNIFASFAKLILSTKQ